jgi:hypothetical protein
LRIAGISKPRITVASISTARAVPIATSLMKIRSDQANAPIATAKSRAAAVISRLVRSTPTEIAVSSLAPRLRSSAIRCSRNTP